MQTITRRHFLRNTAAAGAVGTAVTAPVAVAAIASPVRAGTLAAPTENPKLLAAHEVVLAADAELRAAKDALEWLVDEYRHLWPLAPEEILAGANATQAYRDAVIETDIAGRPIHRDTAELSKRLSKSYREKHRTTCFYLDTAAELRERLDEYRKQSPRGKTAKARQRNAAWLSGVIHRHEVALSLAVQYEADVAHIRKESGVESVKARIEAAKQARNIAIAHLCKLTAFTTAGVAIKVEALRLNTPRFFWDFGNGTDPLDSLINALTHIAVPQA